MTLPFKHVKDLFHLAGADMMAPQKGLTLSWWPALTELCGGLRPNELSLICAPTGAGKTQLLANISAQMIEQDIPQFCAPIETGDVDYVKRVISALEQKDFNDGRSIDLARWKMIASRRLQQFENAKMIISSHENRVSVSEMINTLKYLHQEFKIRIAVLDNLNFFLDVVSSQMEKAEMDNAVHEFVILAKKLPIHIILVVHPRKTDGGRVVSEFDIKGSSTAVQECSNVLLFNRPSQEHMDKEDKRFTDREVVFRKLRKRGSNVGIPFWFQYSNGRYRELNKI